MGHSVWRRNRFSNFVQVDDTVIIFSLISGDFTELSGRAADLWRSLGVTPSPEGYSGEDLEIMIALGEIDLVVHDEFEREKAR